MPEWIPPSDRLPADGTWESAGVPGGIPDRSTIYATITPTGANQYTELQTAINDCPSGQVVLIEAGSLRCDNTISIGWGRSITLRGTIDEVTGARLTTIDTRATTGVIIGTNYSRYEGPNVVVASLTKGATTIEVDDSTDFSVGEVVYLAMENNATDPVFNTYPLAGERLQEQAVRIASKPDGTHYTIEAPGCHGDYTNSPGAKLYGLPFGLASGSGIEDLIIDGTATLEATPLANAVQFDSSYASWARNVEVLSVTVYGFFVGNVHQCEFRSCVAGPNTSGLHTTAGFIVGAATSCLFIDNIIEDNPWLLLQQGANSGHVWAYNLFIDVTRHTGSTDINHGPWIQHILWEGNLFSFLHSDGYYGGASQTFYRNYSYGADLDYVGSGLAGFYLRRGDRYDNIWANQVGREGSPGNNGFGSPNMSNSNDIAPGNTSRMCVAALSTRTNATSGTITAPVGHGVTTGATIDIMWTVEESDYFIPKIRRSVTVGTVSGQSIPFSGGLGDDLPVQDSDMYVPTSNAALYNWWGDWDSANGRPKEWPGTLTTRTNDTSGVVTLETGLGPDFETQVDRAFFAQRGYRYGVGNQAFYLTVTDVTGDVVTFNGTSAALPAEDTELILTPSNFGFQEVDMDVLYTASLVQNWYYPGGIPAVEDTLGGDTLPDSLFLDSAPAFFTEGSIAWPPVTPGSTTESYDIIPAGYRYTHGVNPPIGGSVSFDGSGSTTFTGAGSVTFG